MKDETKKLTVVQETIIYDHDVIAACRTVKDERGEVVSVAIGRDMHRIMPYTEQDRERAHRQRGREGFSYGKAVCVLPSAHFYKKTVYGNYPEDGNLKGEYAEEG